MSWTVCRSRAHMDGLLLRHAREQLAASRHLADYGAASGVRCSEHTRHGSGRPHSRQSSGGIMNISRGDMTRPCTSSS